jgi:hypothetical protein
MRVRDFDPAAGQAFQGDVAIIPVPAHIRVDTREEIAPSDGRLVLQEGELTGHHHAIDLRRERHFRPDERRLGEPALHTQSPRLRHAFGAIAPEGEARLYRDPGAVNAMMMAGILTRPDLAVGVLVVTGGPVVLRHEEHDGIRLPEGRYLIGRQIESAGADERVVAD